MKTLFYVGKAYPHATTLQHLQSMGYRLGIFRNPLETLKNTEFFDYVIDLDFASRDSFRQTLKNTPVLPHIDGLLCTYENYIVFKAIAAEILSLPALSEEAAAVCTDKYDMRSRFLAYNPAITPEFMFVDSEENLLQFAAQVGYPLILKPTNLVKSLLVTKCSSESELLDAYKHTLAHMSKTYERLKISHAKPRLIVERFVTGTMCSIAAFVDRTGKPHFCDGIADLVTAQDVGFDDNFLFARKLQHDIPPEHKERLLSVARDGIAALSMRSSPAHIEIIYNDHEIKLVEIGARVGGYRPFLYKESYELDLVAAEADLAIGAQPSVQGAFANYSAMYELFPSSSGEFVALSQPVNPQDYAYFHQVALPGGRIGQAKDGYKAAAVIGIVTPDRVSFISQCGAVENLQVLTQ